jgi:hypothetical protein
MKIALDNTVLALAVREALEPGASEKARRAAACLEYLGAQGHTFIVPAPAEAEYLTFVPPANQERVAAAFATRFEIVPFDAACGAEFAKLWWERNGGRRLRNDTTDKQRAKFDFQIVACAKVFGADFILTEDPHLANFAGNAMRVRKVADINLPAEQLKLVDKDAPPPPETLAP